MSVRASGQRRGDHRSGCVARRLGRPQCDARRAALSLLARPLYPTAGGPPGDDCGMTMASMQTISNLHQQAPERAPVKTDNLADLQPEAPTLLELAERSWAQPLHRRFHSPRRSRNDSRPYEQRAAECSGGSIRRFRPLGGARSRSPCGSRGCGPLAGATGPTRRRRSSAVADGDSNLKFALMWGKHFGADWEIGIEPTVSHFSFAPKYGLGASGGV